jgi:ligand-binding sensor domain-containing protein/signal transduction histidine kinase
MPNVLWVGVLEQPVRSDWGSLLWRALRGRRSRKALVNGRATPKENDLREGNLLYTWVFGNVNRISRTSGCRSPRLSETGFFSARFFIFSWLLVLACALAANLARARDFSQLSEYQTTTWRVEDGLPQSTVTSIAETADGYLWLGTQNGLVRFDGVKFKVFDENNTPAIKNSRIVRLLSESDGTLWIGTEHSGLVCFRNGQFSDYSVPSRGTTHDYARVFSNDRAGALWQVSCEWQLLRFARGKFDTVSDQWDLSSHDAHALTCDRQGQIWVGTESQLAVLKNGRFQLEWDRTNEENFQVDFLSPSRNGGVWVAANGRLRKFESGHWTADLGAYNWMNHPIYDLFEDKQNRLWVVTLGSGLFRYDPNGQVLHLTSENGLPTDFVRCLTEDREGNLWVGTEGGGLCRLKPSIFQTYGAKQGLASDQVMAVAPARGGGLWIGTDGDALDRWQDGKVRHYGFNDGLRNGHVWSVIQDRHGIVWAGTWDGIFRGTDAGNFIDFSDGQNIGWQVLAIFEDSNGDLWLGQQAFGGITRIHDQERTVVKIPGTSANLDVRSITEDLAGNLWVGTSEDGLYRMNMKDGKFAHYGRPEGLGSDSIWSLYVDQEGVLWVGTCRGGLSRWQNGRFVTWNTKNGLVNDVICQILEDNAGNLWLGSYGGIFRVNKHELNLSASGPSRQIYCVGYNLEDGLPSLECQGGFQPSSYRSPDGRLWFPTIKGLVVVDPAKVRGNLLPPPVAIEDVIADGTSFFRSHGSAAGDLEPAASIPPGNKRLEFQYTALSFSAPDGVRFKYRLEGLEKDWEDAGTKRAAAYSHVPPGNYHFHVIACNSDGVWNDTGATVAIAVLPYFWETKWFLALNVLAALAIIISVARFVERRRLRQRLERAEREQAVEKERSRIAKDIHDDLGANLTEIALLSEFAQEPAASPAQVQADMQKIAAKARSLTQIMDEVVWAVNPKNDTLEKFVTYTCSYVEEYLQMVKIACRLEVPEFLPEIILTSETRHNLFLVVKEALNNIVKHACASEARFQIGLDSGALVLTIRDNGKGFNNDARGVGERNISAGSQKDGLENMRKRIESLGGRIEVESRPGGGMCLTIIIALDPAPPRAGVAFAAFGANGSH